MTATDAEFSVFCPGVLDVLSIGKGDLRLMVGESEDDRERARELISEMLRKGYMIFVETDDGPVRVMGFIASSMTYVIEGEPTPSESTEPEAEPAPRKRGRPRKGTSEVPVSGSKATAVGRTAGG